MFFLSFLKYLYFRHSSRLVCPSLLQQNSQVQTASQTKRVDVKSTQFHSELPSPCAVTAETLPLSRFLLYGTNGYTVKLLFHFFFSQNSTSLWREYDRELRESFSTYYFVFQHSIPRTSYQEYRIIILKFNNLILGIIKDMKISIIFCVKLINYNFNEFFLIKYEI